MNNGCICCTVRGDLIRIIKRLLARKGRLDAIVIETTGLADPAPVAQTFFVDEDIKARRGRGVGVLGRRFDSSHAPD
jgi:G3E family GTPase